MKIFFTLIFACLVATGGEMVSVPLTKLKRSVNDYFYNNVKFDLLLENEFRKEGDDVVSHPKTLKIIIDNKFYQLSFKNLIINGVSIDREVENLSLKYDLNGNSCDGYWISLHLKNGIPIWDSVKTVSVYFDFKKKAFTKFTHANDIIMFPIDKKNTLSGSVETNKKDSP